MGIYFSRNKYKFLNLCFHFFICKLGTCSCEASIRTCIPIIRINRPRQSFDRQPAVATVNFLMLVRQKGLLSKNYDYVIIYYMSNVAEYRGCWKFLSQSVSLRLADIDVGSFSDVKHFSNSRYSSGLNNICTSSTTQHHRPIIIGTASTTLVKLVITLSTTPFSY